jgi:hypothetical protein
MCVITVLRPLERVRLDGEPIAVIYRDLGSTVAEGVVSRALAELAVTLAGLAEQVRGHDVADLGRQLRRIRRMSEHLGMTSLGRITRDVHDCLDRNDATAFSAVWARLMRIAERSLTIDNDLRDQV